MGLLNSRSLLQYSNELVMREEPTMLITTTTTTMPRELLKRQRRTSGCVAPDKNETKRILDFFRLAEGTLIGECIVCYGEKAITSFISTSCFHVVCKSCLVKAELAKKDKRSTCIYCRQDVDRIFIMKQSSNGRNDVMFLPTTLRRLMEPYRASTDNDITFFEWRW